MARKPRLLLVDDEVSLTRLLKLNLEAGYDVHIENSGAKGFTTALAVQPDLIILDIVMPDRNGIELAQEIRAHERLRDVPIIFLTAIAAKARELGEPWLEGAPLLHKPVRIEDVIRCVEQQLRPKAASRA